MTLDRDCAAFRSELERALAPTGAAPLRAGAGTGTAELGWHRHLLSCVACRDLLAAEQALEELLASLPVPHLPEDVAQRVVIRLAAERRAAMPAGELDRLLALAPDPDVPHGLPERVLTGLAPARGTAPGDAERKLDLLLETLPTPAIPPGLAGRVLAGVEASRGRRSSFRLLQGRRRGTVGAPRLAAARRWAAAAVLLASIGVAGLAWRFGAGLVWRDPADAPPTHLPSVVKVGVEVEVEDELLENLDVLENWEVLMSDDLDLMLAGLEPVEWTLFEFGDLEPGGGDELAEDGETGG